MRIVLVAAFIFLLSVPCIAGNIEDAQKALSENDGETALSILLPLAENGDGDAQMTLGAMYEIGRFLPKDHNLSLQWYLRAAEQGKPEAQHLVCLKYYFGEHIIQDHSAALQWCLLAAEQGHLSSQMQLAVMFSKGVAIRRDIVKAHMWSNIASALGFGAAGSYRDLLADRMSPEQVADAQVMAKQWMDEYQKRQSRD